MMFIFRSASGITSQIMMSINAAKNKIDCKIFIYVYNFINAVLVPQVNVHQLIFFNHFYSSKSGVSLLCRRLLEMIVKETTENRENLGKDRR